MGALKPAFFAMALLVPASAQADELDRWQPLIAEASARFGVPSRWIEQVIRTESGGHTHRDGAPIRSVMGAVGLMQLMPATWADLRARLQLGDDPDDPHDNILAGTYYLRLMYERFGYPGLFAAYNAGPARYAEHLAGRPLPLETVRYLAGMHQAIVADRPPLFFIQRSAGKPAQEIGERSLFAVRRDGQ